MIKSSLLKTRLEKEQTCLLFIQLIQEKEVRFRTKTEVAHELLSSTYPGSDVMNCNVWCSTHLLRKITIFPTQYCDNSSRESIQYMPWRIIFLVLKFISSLVLKNYGACIISYCAFSVLIFLSLFPILKNHKAVEVGGHLWMSLNPTYFSKQGQLNNTTEVCVQSGFEYLQGWRLHSTFWTTCSSGWPPIIGKNIFLFLNGISFAADCSYCFWSSHWAPLRRVRVHLLYYFHL